MATTDSIIIGFDGLGGIVSACITPVTPEKMEEQYVVTIHIRQKLELAHVWNHT